MAELKTLHVDQSDYGCIEVTGEDRVRFVQGMCTSDVDKLAEGACLRTAMLDVKGRVTAIVEVVKRADRLVLVCEPGVVDTAHALLAKYAIMDDVEFVVEHRALHRVWGPPSEVWDAPPVFAPAPQPIATPDEVEARRIEAGLPRFGVDVTDSDFPFESRLRETIDYNKGCYLGQEPIARVKSHGKPKRELYGLLVAGDGPVAAGARVSHPRRDDAGVVTSSAVSPVFGPIALAYLHCSVAEPGTRVQVAGREATTAPLPFDIALASR